AGLSGAVLAPRYGRRVVEAGVGLSLGGAVLLVLETRASRFDVGRAAGHRARDDRRAALRDHPRGRRRARARIRVGRAERAAGALGRDRRRRARHRVLRRARRRPLRPRPRPDVVDRRRPHGPVDRADAPHAAACPPRGGARSGRYGRDRRGGGVRRRPLVTAALTAVTAATALAQAIEPSLLARLERTHASLHGQEWRLVTTLFVQDGGVAGALSNLVFLVVIGAVAEQLLSRRMWLALY